MTHTNDQFLALIDEVARKVDELDRAADARAVGEAEILDRLDALEAPPVRAQETVPPRPESIERDANGRVIVRDDVPSFEERMRARRAQEDAEFAARHAAAREGLPTGFWRDPMGLVRAEDGRLATRVGDGYEAPPA
jgi:hypothetical protein